jgi:5-methyltetrahydropteroyltriglutamate--homocysteine methyltransferase
MRLSTDRILTTHMGSLPRVGRLADLLLARHDGRAVDDREVAAEAETAMAEVVDRQVEAGVDVGHDGEMPRTAFMLYPQERMKGFGGQTTQRKVPLDVQRFPKWAASRKSLRRRPMDASITPAVVSELSYDDVSGVAAECAAFRRVLDARGGGFVETFMTAVSPGMVAVVYENKHYDSHETYVRAIAREMKKEYDYIVGQGLILQIDAPDMAMERQRFFQDCSPRAFLDNVALHVDALNAALADVPPERVRLHACWGNRDSPHFHDVPCGEVLPLFRDARVGALCLPFANPRHAHEIDVLREHPLPDRMVLIPGAIETTNNYVEHPALVAERIERAVAAVGDRERVIAGTDCGFSTLAGDVFVAEDVVWAKLAALRQGADLASARLWGAAR